MVKNRQPPKRLYGSAAFMPLQWDANQQAILYKFALIGEIRV
jgi:hypothetical protein